MSFSVFSKLFHKCNRLSLKRKGWDRKIRSFRSNIDKSLINYEKCNETTIHFNCTKHVLNEDLQFFILVNSLSNDIIRRSKETDLINYFKTLKINILNSKIPDSKYITNLFFYR